MKCKNLFVLLLIIIFPIIVNGEQLDTPISLGYGEKIQQHSYIFTSPAYYYIINGQTAYCMDQHTPNPNNLNQVEVYYVTEGGSFANGLIAMMNYNLTQNYNAGLYDAIRLYTASSSYTKGNQAITAGDDWGSGNHVARVRNFYDVAKAAENGDRTYLPSTNTSSDIDENSFDLEVVDDSNINNIRVRINFNGNKPTNFKMTNTCTTSDSNVSCTIKSSLDSNNEFIIRLEGKSKGTNNVTVKFNFSSGSGSGKMYDKVYIYTCIGDKYECNQVKHVPGSEPQFGFQRFLTVDGDLVDSNGSKLIKEIKVTVPGICDVPNLSDEEKLKNGCCDQIDGSKYADDSPEQDTYIKYCGPIVHTENECGGDSCEAKDYKDFSHSYVKLRNMSYILDDFKKNGDFEEIKSYLDDDLNNNGYCGIYTTETLDIFTPATAASVSGQFFIFDSYTNTNYNNINSYFRQPYVVERVKSAFLFSYKKWKAAYDNALKEEEKAYNAWQSAVKAVGSTYNAYARVKDYIATNDSRCQGNKRYTQTCIDYITAVDQQKKDTEQSWNDAKENQSIALRTYQDAVSKRIGLQGARDECMDKASEFQNNYTFNFDGSTPTVKFTYSQNSQKEGNQTYTFDMVENKEAVKYWPNVTSGSSTANYGDDGYYENNTTIQKIEDRNGVYLIDEYGKTGTYNFPNSIYDGCSGNKCTEYKYNGYIYSARQGKTDATDPYGKISVKDSETISKIYYYRPENNTFALMNSGEYKTLDYESNADYASTNGLQIGYVYNIELTAYKGSYDTAFAVSNYGYKTNGGRYLIKELLEEFNIEFSLDGSLTSKCSYCNMEMAFKRNCDVCDPNTTYDFEPQFYYRSISLASVTPTGREPNESNWSDAKGEAAKKQIELGSGTANVDTGDSNSNYIAVATDNFKENKGNITTYLADSSSVGKHDIYDASTKEYLEYEVTLTSQDLKTIKRNSSRAHFDYSKMKMCTGNSAVISKDSDTEYCFTCNSDMKECESTFITSYFSDTSGREKWKYYVHGTFCRGTIKQCINGLNYTTYDNSSTDGVYPDPLFPKEFLNTYKNWP